MSKREDVMTMKSLADKTTLEDMALIDELDQNRRVGPHPDHVNF